MALGMAERAASLAKAAPDQAQEVEAAYHRLTAPDQMGVLFKVLGLAGRDWPDGAGFTPVTNP
jgi:NADH dehydrogenase [ubiquinone] 1 alpha subcomplex assembly factor 7